MIGNLLLAADLIDAVANPYRTIEEHEIGSARLAALAVHGARFDIASLKSATSSDTELLPEHVWRWVINEAKQASDEHGGVELPAQDLIEALYSAETDRVGRLLLVEAVLTHPETELKLNEFDEVRSPIPLEQLPNVWPRDRLIRLSRASEDTREGEGESAETSLAELGMLLLQIGTPPALALLGGTVMALQDRREHHALLETIQAVVTVEDEDLWQRVWGRPERGRPD
jgi:hypothetical protein